MNLRWSFNIERAPWWDGLFERMVQLLKRCLPKMVGQSRLTNVELLTSVTEVEMILNSRPLTYIFCNSFPSDSWKETNDST